MTVEAYWDKSDDELYELIGAALLGDGPGLSPEDEEEHRRFGREWFTNKHRELQRRICHDPRLQGLLGTTSSDRLLDAAGIYGVLQGLEGDSAVTGAVNSAVLAVLVARIGLGTFCVNARPDCDRTDHGRAPPPPGGARPATATRFHA
ncbi:hypothetical protein [Kitasatospora cheerisanensis]|uniref:Uncharacterized protein n=1 Tax=Kitasatospora cheerisanensis KCTC 2395 TaxID=1348663 RepID=A0A066YT12_9ACTN|nr:hypothetical protein [Kitasatospora cheerisanensis]KDN81196.1 hypothetical protein KCH_70070 [Kitasatospora cheerisanensis KCTC 2395]